VRADVLTENRRKHQQTPHAEHDRRHGSEQLHGRAERTAQPQGGKLGKEQGNPKLTGTAITRAMMDDTMVP
jgi:hypothetical protein